MSDYYAPNQQVVGVEPAAASVEPEEAKTKTKKTAKTDTAKDEDAED